MNSKSTSYEDQARDYVRRLYEGKVKTSLTDDKLKALKSKMLQSVELDIQYLVARSKFISGLLLRIPVKPVRDVRVQTAQTDGDSIYFDIDFYSNLSTEERVFVLAHEAWHCALLHFLRRENRDRELWNIATDCEINYALKDDDFVLPEGVCLPLPEDEGKSAEEIYENLLKKNKNQKKNRKSGGNSGGDEGDDQSSSSGFGQSSRGFRQSSSSNSNSRNSSQDKRLRGQFDKHADKMDDSRQDVDFQSPSDKWGEKGFDDDYNPAVSESVTDKIREMVISEAQRYERTKGRIPSCVKRMIDSICKPEVRWEELLAQFVTTCLGDRRQWLPPLRRGVYNEMYFQSRRGEKINVTCIVDTSGSTEADLPKFLTELVSLLETFGRYELTLIHCDCEVHKVDTFDDGNPFPLDNFKEYAFLGGGGSSLLPAFDEIHNRALEPSCVVVFTDGYIDCPEQNPTGIPTLFVLTSDGTSPAEWGTSIRFKDKKHSEDDV